MGFCSRRQLVLDAAEQAQRERCERTIKTCTNLICSMTPLLPLASWGRRRQVKEKEAQGRGVSAVQGGGA